MFRKEINTQSPLRILEQSIHGGLGKGNLGVVMARAGIGKTAFMVQIGLDDLMRERDVLHVALGQQLEHVQSWYDALFSDLANLSNLDDRESVRMNVVRRRCIQAYVEHKLSAERLEKAVELYKTHLNLQPSAILIDGFDWEGPVAATASTLGAFKATAQRLGAELWMTAQTHRSTTPAHPESLTPPCNVYGGVIDVAVFLESVGDHVTVRILKDHGHAVPSTTHLELRPDTMRLIFDEEDRGQSVRLPPSAYTLLSGGAQGAEQAFGACADRYGLHEMTFSYPGRAVARDRGLVELSDVELKAGAVSPVYLRAQMHREFPSTPNFQKMLQTIWHQVNTAGQVFVVGTILSDQTVKGGTGWAAELGRHWNKPVYVYDQSLKRWVHWKAKVWVECEPPRISSTRFTGSGTRFLNEDGQKAIDALFERSFGR